MRIGQVTMCGDNYGACLQAYALQHVLKANGCDIEFVRYNRSDENGKENFLKKINKLGLDGVVKYILEYSFIKNRKDAYNRFRNNYIRMSECSYDKLSNLDELAGLYDTFICGSDMIWSEEFQDDWDFYFLNFVAKEKSNSYAPSFGKNSLTDDNKKRVKEFLEKFNRVTCREEGGVELVRSISNVDAHQVLDPTMLLSAEEWMKVIGTRERIIKEPYVFMYLFGKDDVNRIRYIKDIECFYGKAYKLPFSKKETKRFPVKSVGPIEYIRLFKDAEFVITDTFHGLMFSMIFNKQFVVLDRSDTSKWAKYSDRMTSTLKMFGLYDRYVYADKMFAKDLKEINYEYINKTIIEKRNEAMEYLMGIVREK